MNAEYAIERPTPTRGKRGGGAVLAASWILLIAAYTFPLWVPGYVSWDFAISVTPPVRMWMVVALGVLLLLLPPLALGVFTWRWARRRQRA